MRTYIIIKWLLEVLIVLAAMPLILLIFIFVILKMRKNKEKDIFFKQPRIGRHGKVFLCYKFKTMDDYTQEEFYQYLDSNPKAKEEWELNHKLQDDPRVTEIGHFLRKTSLDELPQIINILKGEMGLIGPRPILLSEKVLYGEKLKEYASVRPGITGLWQVSGRSETTFNERIALDVQYTREISLWNDLKILFKTINVVLKRDGAY